MTSLCHFSPGNLFLFSLKLCHHYGYHFLYPCYQYLSILLRYSWSVSNNAVLQFQSRTLPIIGAQKQISILSVLFKRAMHANGLGLNSSPPGQNGPHFADDIFKRIFLNENIWISNKISLKYVPWGVIDNMAALVQIMAWCRPGVKPLSESMMNKFTDAYMRH